MAEDLTGAAAATTFKTPVHQPDTRRMTKRSVLWLAALTILGFVFLAAVNASHDVAGTPEGPRSGLYGTYYAAPTAGTSYCGGFGSLDDWFSKHIGYEEVLPSRLAVLIIGFGIALVPIYFAEKAPPPIIGEHAGPKPVPSHSVLQNPKTYVYWCEDCSFSSRDVHEAKVHRGDFLVPGQTQPGAGRISAKVTGFDSAPGTSRSVNAGPGSPLQAAGAPPSASDTG